MPDVTAQPFADERVEQLISRMRHGIETCPFPPDRRVYRDRDSTCIALLEALLVLRRMAAGLDEAA